MSHQRKYPTMIVGPEMMFKFHTSSVRHASPKAWYSPPQPWHFKNGTSPQGGRNSYYNQCHSPNGYWDSPRQWSLNRWEPAYDRQSWGSSPRAPHISHFKHSPEHAAVYNERKDERTQVSFKQKRGYIKDISHYYSPSMVEDPWAELEAKQNKSTPQLSARVRHNFIAGSQAPL